ncbi:MAG: hypothetical protein HYW89_02450 [Candidatus Sungiibacteriota bacterium]|uniref:Uncharacterized protein n=1 Tax=Candidatus Sungiibacteriota bacterium TaxID=2750080 RepID=A0A7T5RL73_9BACT|nr:MAG: hypothetical protein HYW89_02450 [Candidatus Sungbacteria bacterium]
MPIREQLQPETQDEESGEIVITPEDKTRLQELIEDIGDKSLKIFWDGGVIELRRRLRVEGRRAAQYILEMIERDLVSEDPVASRRLYCELNWLFFCATPNEAKRISKVLTKDKIVREPDRSKKIAIFEILQRIGTEETIDDLTTFVRKEKSESPYFPESDFWYIYDLQDIFRVLMAIRMRARDIDKFVVAISKINEFLQENNQEPFSFGPATIEYYWQELNPRRLERELENFFIENPRSLYAGPEYAPEATDRVISDFYAEGNIQEVESRLEVVRRLRHEARKEKKIKEEPEKDDTKFLRRHWLEYREENPSPYAPTLGIEIEIRAHSVLPPELARKPQGFSGWEWYEQEEWMRKREQIIEEKRQPYHGVEKLGVPRGGDGFWEFAHKPVRNYFTLSKEVQALIAMDLINREDQRHAMHLTIGGVEVEGGGNAYLLARVLEASAWSTRGKRLLRPYLSKYPGWTINGRGGVKERLGYELELGATLGIEIRTFQLQSLTGLDRLLKSAYLLGAALKSCQELKRNDPLNVGQKQEVRIKLTDIWHIFSDKSKDIFTKFGLQEPDDIWSTRELELAENVENSPFYKLAQLLDEAEAEPKSTGAGFVREIRRLIISTRAKIEPIIYPKPV